MIHGNWFQSWARVVPEKAALIEAESGKIVTYRQLENLTWQTCQFLRELGLNKGDRVAVLGQNRIEQIILYFAAARLGLILVPANWRLAPQEVDYVLEHSSARCLFWSADVDKLFSSLQKRPQTVVGFDHPEGQNFYNLINKYPARPPEEVELEEKTPLMLLYTSGTTGRPKGAVLTHGSITWNAIITSTCWDLRHDDITITHTPLFHTGGWNVLTLPLLHRGATVVLCNRFEPSLTLEWIARYRVSVMFAVPTMFQMLLDEKPKREQLASARFFISGGAPCPVPLIRAWQELGLVFKQGYGLTEVGPNCFVLHERDAVRKAGSVGFPVLHLDSRIADDKGREVGPEEIGELQLRGPTVCGGYFNDPRATAEAMLEGGWFRTGDLFRRDAEGYHYVVGRLKEMYISGGENVYPAEIERVLYEYSGVKEAAVVGVPHPKWGEVGAAFVALAPGSGPVDAEKILDFCRSRLARYKVPKTLRVLDVLPKGASGKIQKSELKALAVKEQ